MRGCGRRRFAPCIRITSTGSKSRTPPILDGVSIPIWPADSRWIRAPGAHAREIALTMRVLFLGAASSIGRALAARFARDGATLFLAARDRDDLERIADDLR